MSSWGFLIIMAFPAPLLYEVGVADRTWKGDIPSVLQAKAEASEIEP